jgi:hypothetical protein
MTAHVIAHEAPRRIPRPLDEFDRLAIEAQTIFSVKGETTAALDAVADLLRNEFASALVNGTTGAGT